MRDDAHLSLHETVLLCLSGSRARSWLAQWPPSFSLLGTAPPLHLLSNAQPNKTHNQHTHVQAHCISSILQ